VTVASRYADFAAREAHGVSATYERLALAVAGDPDLLALLGTLSPAKQQPQLLFAVVRFLGGPVEDPQEFHDFALTHWAAIARHMTTKATQTNEAGRCALLLPVLSALPQPLALLEVGAAAGLCLYPDRYSYAYNDHAIGAAEPMLRCDLTGTVAPTRRPEVVWRAGLDLNPLDVSSADDVAWLDALIWPEHHHRRDRLRAAVRIAAQDPPLLVPGDLVDDLPDLVAQAPTGATLVVFHTSVLYQVPPDHRARFLKLASTLPGHWICVEAPDVVTYPHLPPAPDSALHNVLGLDGTPLAWTRGHGQSMTWFG
jgi:hypothetical protein